MGSISLLVESFSLYCVCFLIGVFTLESSSSDAGKINFSADHNRRSFDPRRSEMMATTNASIQYDGGERPPFDV